MSLVIYSGPLVAAVLEDTDNTETSPTPDTNRSCQNFVYKNEPWYASDDLEQYLWDIVVTDPALEVAVEITEGLVLVFLLL